MRTKISWIQNTIQNLTLYMGFANFNWLKSWNFSKKLCTQVNFNNNFLNSMYPLLCKTICCKSCLIWLTLTRVNSWLRKIIFISQVYSYRKTDEKKCIFITCSVFWVSKNKWVAYTYIHVFNMCIFMTLGLLIYFV